MGLCRGAAAGGLNEAEGTKGQGPAPLRRASYTGIMYPHQKLDWSASRIEARLADHPDDTAARLELARV